ncbi:MAG TPA: tRNA pseudouridine(55) synthase TruB [Geobacteraceae bacterium]|nr:tRNA pseudouridine(55) synthase TruB [Geobacteraceae bacterium]
MLDGFLVVDKPSGVTSHHVVAILRRTFGQKKIGHTGTLDPFATGVLPIALGEGTKAITFLDESVKEYRATMRLGVSTDTQDLEGDVLQERDWRGVTPAMIEAVLPAFRGEIFQVPPMFSALKRDGVPLYKLARKGETVEREARRIFIHLLTIDRIELPEVSFVVRCSRGTYVRTLAHDMGEALGCGAHLLQLRRTASGSFALADAFTLDQLTEASPREIAARHFISIRKALAHLPELELSDSGYSRIKNGIAPGEADFEAAGGFPPAGQVVLCHRGVVAAVAEVVAPDEHQGGKHMRICRGFNQVYPLH